MQVFVLPWAMLCLDMSLGQGPVPQQSANAPWGWQHSVCALSNAGEGSQSWQTRPLLWTSQIAKHLCFPSAHHPALSATSSFTVPAFVCIYLPFFSKQVLVNEQNQLYLQSSPTFLPRLLRCRSSLIASRGGGRVSLLSPPMGLVINVMLSEADG